MTKEEIQAKIEGFKIGTDTIHEFNKFVDNKDLIKGFDMITKMIDRLFEKLESAKSIQDLQKEAFEAGRKGFLPNNFGKEYFRTFEDYLKSIEK